MENENYLDDLVKLSMELGLYDESYNTCEKCKEKQGYLTRISKRESLVLCDDCYIIEFGVSRR